MVRMNWILPVVETLRIILFPVSAIYMFSVESSTIPDGFLKRDEVASLLSEHPELPDLLPAYVVTRPKNKTKKTK